MSMQTIVMVLVGVAFIVLGYFMTTRESVARWGVTNGRGRIWSAMLGEERATKLTMRFFGPLTIVIGVLTLGITIAGR